MKSIYSGSGMPPFLDAVVAFEKDLWRRRQRVVRILSVDPGDLTGVCVLWIDPDTGEILGWGETIIAHDEIKQVWSLMALLRTLADLGRVWVVIEDFRVQQVNMEESFLSPVRVGRRFEFGVEMMATGELGEGPVFGSIELPVVWNSNSRKADFDDARLKKMGFYTPGPDHRRDATRHALVRWKQLKLELPFAVRTEASKFWEPGLAKVELKHRVTRSFNGSPTGSHGQPGKLGVTKADMERIKMEKNGSPNGKRNWVPVAGIAGWVREHDPETESGLAPMEKKAPVPDVQKTSPKAKKRVVRRLM